MRENKDIKELQSEITELQRQIYNLKMENMNLKEHLKLRWVRISELTKEIGTLNKFCFELQNLFTDIFGRDIGMKYVSETWEGEIIEKEVHKNED